LNRVFPKAVIDSGPLFDALVLNYEHQRSQYGRAPRFTSILDEVLQNVTAQKQFLGSLFSIREKLTTSHVIAELYGLEKGRLGLNPPDLYDFRRTSIELLMQWGIDERLIRLLDLASHDSFRSCLTEIGVTDTGLIDLAVRHDCVLITWDARTLAREASIRQVECIFLRQLVTFV
jgi:rRNA-processing protein FCF1